MSKTISLNLDDTLYERFKIFASMDNRSLANLFRTAAAYYIESRMLVDDFEMEEIKNNRELVDRIRAGSKYAAKREGRFID